MPSADNVRSISDRARSSSSVDAQESMFDKVIEDDELLAALDEREEKRAARLEANGAFKIAADNAKDLLVNHHIEVGEVVRVGRHRIKKTRIAPTSVSFDTSGSERLNFGLINEED